MSTPYASGKRAHGICDRCGLTYRLRTLKTETVAGRANNLLVCRSCWDLDHPQNWQGRYPVFDPQALRNPRPDTGLQASRVLNPDPVPTPIPTPTIPPF
jgi:hypothetical protein